MSYWCINCKFVNMPSCDEPCLSCNALDGVLVGAPNNWARKTEESAEPQIRDSGERTEFPTGAVRDMHGGKGRFDLLPWEAIWEVAKHCERGSEKYGERNCEKGIPIHSLCDSAMRHLAKYMMGLADEPHLVAAAWNVLFAIWMEIKRPEMQDIPSRMEVTDGHCNNCNARPNKGCRDRQGAPGKTREEDQKATDNCDHVPLLLAR